MKDIIEEYNELALDTILASMVYNETDDIEEALEKYIEEKESSND